MKAIIVHQYGGPEVLKFEDYPDPTPGPGQVLVKVAATSINPVDIGRRSGRMKDFFPIKFPGIIGVDVAGTIARLGAGVEGLSVGQRVFAYADQAYAELCVVPAVNLAEVPQGLDLIDAAALPLVTTTGYQLITQGAAIQPGQTVLVTGAVGSVGRAAAYTAKTRGAVVIAGVLKRQFAQAATLGADQVVATDDAAHVAKIPPLDAVVDLVGGSTGAALLGKVKPGGVYVSALGPVANASDYPSVRVVSFSSKPDAKTLVEMARAVIDGKLTIAIGRRMPLSQTADGHAAVEKGGIGKVLLTA